MFLWVWAALLAGLPAAFQPARAQVPDTTAAPPDTVRAARRPAQTALPPLFGFPAPEPGEPVVDTLPARQSALEVTEFLARVPGSFAYTFGAPGWPGGWSPYGLPPQQVQLLLEGRPFEDLVTGRPHYDLLPLGFLEGLRLHPTRLGAPLAVLAHLRPFPAPQPYSELRYWAGADGLQSIEAVHTQQRRRALFGRPGLLGLLGGYVGRAAAGPYGEASRLRRERKLYTRLRYEQEGWSVELSNLHNRRRLGAHGGVRPFPGTPFETIYATFEPLLVHTEARRQTLRNDLSLTAQTRLLPVRGPLAGSLYWTAETFRYWNAPDTVTAHADRLGFWVRQALPVAGHEVSLRLEGWHDRVRLRGAAAEGTGPRSALHAALRDSFSLGGLGAVLDGGLHLDATGLFPGGSLGLAHGGGALRLFARATLAGQPVSWVEQYGFGPYLQPVARVPSGRVLQGQAGLEAAAGPFDLTLTGFAGWTSEPLDLYAVGTPDAYGVVHTDTARAIVAGAPLRRVGLTADAGWRRLADRGFYAVVQPTLLQEAGGGARASALPALFARGRLGARYLLFQGDLDLDLYLQGRFWSAMQSRTLHPPTGLLVLPPPDARVFGPSGTLDVVAEAGVRTATLFLVYEHLLGGTVVQTGTLIVPTYPLPERRLRFGVYWPIPD